MKRRINFIGDQLKVFLGLSCAIGLLSACTPKVDETATDAQASPYLLIFAGDQDEKDSDFLIVMDVNPQSKTRGQPISSLPIGHKMSMPHHMEYVRPPKGEPIFMNAHHHELSMIVDVSDPEEIVISKKFTPPAPFRFPHDYTRTPDGTRLVGFLRSEGASPNLEEQTLPGNHGGIAEYSIDGELIRTTSAAVSGYEKPIRPYAFALLPEIDRFVVTSAPMMEKSWADVVQIYRYSDFKLLHTLDLPVGRLESGETIEGSQAAGFGPRILDDGSVFLNSYGCAFYHLTAIGSETPELKMVYTLNTKASPKPNQIRGACGIPFRIGQYWIQPVGRQNAVVVLDISNPDLPKEVYRFDTPKDFKPHWLAKDPLTNRLVLGAELGGEHGFYILRFDDQTGTLVFDANFQGSKGAGLFKSKRAGYISLENKQWPHGETGFAWGHAALFLEGE